MINVGRGPLVVESALYEALSAGTIAAAALDVWYRYPGPDGDGTPSDLPFDTLPNVLMTPHVSGSPPTPSRHGPTTSRPTSAACSAASPW